MTFRIALELFFEVALFGLGAVLFFYGEKYIRWWNGFVFRKLPPPSTEEETPAGRKRRKKSRKGQPDEFANSVFFHIFIRLTKLAGILISFFSGYNLFVIIQFLIKHH